MPRQAQQQEFARFVASNAGSNMALNLAPFGRWTLRDKAAQRRLALRYASAPFGVSGIVLQVNPHVGHSCPHPPMVISPCPFGHSPLRMRKSLSIYRSLSPGFPPSTSIRSGSARSISISRPFKPRITQRSMSRFALDLRQLASSANFALSLIPLCRRRKAISCSAVLFIK